LIRKNTAPRLSIIGVYTLPCPNLLPRSIPRYPAPQSTVRKTHFDTIPYPRTLDKKSKRENHIACQNEDWACGVNTKSNNKIPPGDQSADPMMSRMSVRRTICEVYFCNIED
jgi:hypothetical protein